MKYYSTEELTTKNFSPLKTINIYNKNRLLYVYKTNNSIMTLTELKRQTRHNNQCAFNNDKLAIVDNDNLVYHYAFNKTFDNIVDNYKQYKILLKYLQDKQHPIIEVQTKDSKKVYKKTFKIIYQEI